MTSFQLVFFHLRLSTFSGKTLPVAEDWQIQFESRLTDKKRKVKVMIVLETKELYESDVCMKEIVTAKLHDVQIVCLKFLTEHLDTNKKWENAKIAERNSAMAALKTQSIPNQGCFLSDVKGNLETLITYLSQKVHDGRSLVQNYDEFLAQCGASGMRRACAVNTGKGPELPDAPYGTTAMPVQQTSWLQRGQLQRTV